MQAKNLPTVLVVEDNFAMNTAICDILELNAYRVISAQNGEDALRLLAERKPDVILSDIMMPRMTGYDLLRHTRTEEDLRTIPFIFLTARSASDDQRLAKQIGIEDYLVKPVEPEDLLLAVENALRRASAISAETRRQMDNLRNEIVSTLQHEFRTPLTFILGYAEYLSEISKTDVDIISLQEAVGAILEGGGRLQDLIEKFLTLADLQSRHKLDGFTGLNPYALLSEVAFSHSLLAQKAELKIVLSAQNQQRQILGSHRYLSDAIHLLLENAILYRRPDSCRIQLSVESADGFIGLRIADEGQGIPAPLLDGLRVAFAQVDRDNRTVPGAGLSLALVQQIVRLHGGQLQMESEEGVGSTVVIWLPEHTPEQAGVE